ncbi:MAG: putative quinol monooxygenase [Pirellula sp.]
MKNPTFAIVVTFEIKPECIETFRARVIQQAKDSVDNEPGCCQFDVLEDESNPNTIVLYETYIDANAFVDHKQTPHFLDFDRTVGPWIAAKQVRRLKLLEQNLDQ